MTIEQICGNCHFFGRPRKGIRDDVIAYVDNDEPILGELRICGFVEHFNMNLPDKDLPKDHPVVTDESGYYAALRVPKDFGCIKWQAKEIKPDGQTASE